MNTQIHFVIHRLLWLTFLTLLVVLSTSRLPVQAASASAFALSDSDPTLEWNTFLGGGDADGSEAIVLGPNRDVFVAGTSALSWAAPIRAFSKGSDAFVARFHPNGNLMWLTFLGGKGDDAGHALVVDSQSNIYVTGSSSAGWGAPLQSYHPGASDAYLAKLNSDGALQWHTFFGASGEQEAAGDWTSGITLDADENVLLTGTSTVEWGDPLNHLVGGYDTFVASFSPDGALQWNTFLGSDSPEMGELSGLIQVDTPGNIYLSITSSGAWSGSIRDYSGDMDILLVKLANNGVEQWHTYLGGGSGDYAGGFAVDDAGNLYVTGLGGSHWGTPKLPMLGIYDAVVAKVNTNGGLEWTTNLGGTDWHAGSGIAIAESDLYIVGWSRETWGTPLRPYAGGQDAFVSKLTLDGDLIWNTFLGGSGADSASSIVTDAYGALYVIGSGDASWGEPKRAFTAEMDGFLARLSNAVAPTITMTRTGTDDKGHSYIRFAAQDLAVGIAGIQVTKLDNANSVVMPFDIGATTPIRITVTGSQPTNMSSVRVKVTNVVGRSTIANALFQQLVVTGSKRVERTFDNLPLSQHYLQIVNGTPGLERLRIQVNGKLFQVVELQPGAARSIDLGSVMTHASNRIALTGIGGRSNTVLVIIADSVPGIQ